MNIGSHTEMSPIIEQTLHNEHNLMMPRSYVFFCYLVFLLINTLLIINSIVLSMCNFEPNIKNFIN